jgi:hypothetical protein
MKLPEQRKWKLFFYFSENNNGVLIRKDKAPDFSSRGLLSFSVQSLLVRCGFQSPATQDKPIQKFNAFTVFTSCSFFLAITYWPKYLCFCKNSRLLEGGWYFSPLY